MKLYLDIEKGGLFFKGMDNFSISQQGYEVIVIIILQKNIMASNRLNIWFVFLDLLELISYIARSINKVVEYLKCADAS